MNTRFPRMNGFELGMFLAVLGAAQTIGCGAAEDDLTSDPEKPVAANVDTAEQALSFPSNGINWGWGNVNDVRLDGGDNVITVAGGTTVNGTEKYAIDAGSGGCPGCISQIVMGTEGGSKQCIYSGTGIVSGSASFSLTAPSAPGSYPVWAQSQWQYTCQDAVNLSNGGSAVALIAVYADPFSWGWGKVSNVKVNGKSSKRIRVEPGSSVSLSEDYFIDAGSSGCPGCISQIVMGIEGGSKECIYSGVGVVSNSASFALKAPTQKGIYQVWAQSQWQYTCQDAVNLSNGGSAVAFVEVDTCSHDKCVQGSPLSAGCDNQCVTDICAVDPYCCNNAWDSTCVNEVTTVCKQSC